MQFAAHRQPGFVTQVLPANAQPPNKPGSAGFVATGVSACLLHCIKPTHSLSNGSRIRLRPKANHTSSRVDGYRDGKSIPPSSSLHLDQLIDNGRLHAGSVNGFPKPIVSQTPIEECCWDSNKGDLQVLRFGDKTCRNDPTIVSEALGQARFPMLPHEPLTWAIELFSIRRGQISYR